MTAIEAIRDMRPRAEEPPQLPRLSLVQKFHSRRGCFTILECDDLVRVMTVEVCGETMVFYPRPGGIFKLELFKWLRANDIDTPEQLVGAECEVEFEQGAQHFRARYKFHLPTKKASDAVQPT